MIRLEQPKNTPGSMTMAVEIEVLPLESPEHKYVNLRIRYLISNRQVLEMESAIHPGIAQDPLTWLEKAIKTRQKKLSETFGAWVSLSHLICIEQTRLAKTDFSEIQAEFGAEAHPYPFVYAIDVLVNPDSEGLAYAGIGMRFNGLNYSELNRFLAQLRNEVNDVWTHQNRD